MAALVARVVVCLQVLLPGAERSQDPLVPLVAGHGKANRKMSVLAPDHEAPSSLMEHTQVANCTEGPLLQAIFEKLGAPQTDYLHDPEHCRWSAITCHKNDTCHVKKLRLRMVLPGELPRELGALKKLQVLDLAENPKLRGDLAALGALDRSMEHLQVLSLQDTNITGNLASLRGMRQLQKIYLQRSQVTGSLESLKELKSLRMLYLQNTQVSGSLRHLANLTQLSSIFLRNTQVSGSLVSLEAMHLVRLEVQGNARVSGDIKSLQGMTRMWSLGLSGTNVTGSISALKGMTKLQFLHASETGVAGSLWGLQAMKVLKELHLSKNPGITGNLTALTQLPNLEEVRLASTRVSGRVHLSWGDALRRLRILDLAASRAELLMPAFQGLADKELVAKQLGEGHAPRFLLESLEHLDVSGCPLDEDMITFRATLKFFRNLRRVVASGCHLIGDLSGGHDIIPPSWYYLDLSRNRLDVLDLIDVPMFFSIAGNPALEVKEGLLRRSLQQGRSLDFSGVDFTKARREPRELLAQGMIKVTETASSVNDTGGYACHELTSTGLWVTPSLFLPDELCGCLPGWRGQTKMCERCPRGYYNSKFNMSSCMECPPGSNTTEPGASSVEHCQCDVGRIDAVNRQCLCEAHTALHSGTCASCDDLHLDCPEAGTLAETAEPKTGYARLRCRSPLAFRCMDLAKERCNASANGSDLGCALGYEGPLCTACAEGYRSSGTRCAKCRGDAKAVPWGALATGALAVAAAAGACLALTRSRLPAAAATEPAPAGKPTARQALGPLLLAQAPVLLQLVQLWGVLVALDVKMESDGDAASSLWEQEYVQWLQLTAGGLRDALSLDCAYGRTARTLSALVAPCVLPILLVLCVLVEALRFGRGVNFALKALSLLFIGGASSCAKLMHCQQMDGDGVSLRGDAFRSQLPHVLCSESAGEAAWADAIGLGCAISYCLVIPAFLLYLILKQHLVFTPSRRYVSFADSDGDKTVVRVVAMGPQAKADAMDKDLTEPFGRSHLLASAVAYSAVFFRGAVRLKLQGATLTIQQVASQDGRENELEFDASMAMSSVLEQKADADLMRWQKITRMLTERCIMEQVEASDRIFAGAKEIFLKYAACQEVWVEVGLKLVAVALVAVASTYHNLMMTLGLTLGTAITLGTLKPYGQRQVNDLQCCCFLCLTFAAAGFAWSMPWLARSALLVPVGLGAAQTLRPDGPEALALRLFEDATAHWPAMRRGDVVELSVETVSFL